MFDAAGKINLTLWNTLIPNVVDGESYEFTSMRFKDYNGKFCLTSTYNTKMNNTLDIDEEEIVIPEDFCVEESTTITCEGVLGVGNVDCFSLCSMCSKKIPENDIHKVHYLCSGCNQNMRNNRLKKGFVGTVDVQGGEDGEEQVTLLLNSKASMDVDDGSKIVEH